MSDMICRWINTSHKLYNGVAFAFDAELHIQKSLKELTKKLRIINIDLVSTNCKVGRQNYLFGYSFQFELNRPVYLLINYIKIKSIFIHIQFDANNIKTIIYTFKGRTMSFNGVK